MERNQWKTLFPLSFLWNEPVLRNACGQETFLLQPMWTEIRLGRGDEDMILQELLKLCDCEEIARIWKKQDLPVQEYSETDISDVIDKFRTMLCKTYPDTSDAILVAHRCCINTACKLSSTEGHFKTDRKMT